MYLSRRREPDWSAKAALQPRGGQLADLPTTPVRFQIDAVHGGDHDTAEL